MFTDGINYGTVSFILALADALDYGIPFKLFIVFTSFAFKFSVR